MKFDTRLYFKKLLLVFCNLCLFIVIYLFDFFLFGVPEDLSPTNPEIRTVILMIVPLIVLLIIAYRKRLQKNNLRSEYFTYFNRQKPKLKNEIKFIINSTDFIAEVSAFSTMLLIFLCMVVFNIKNNSPVFVNVLAGLIILITMICLFSFVNALIWHRVHKSWLKILA